MDIEVNGEKVRWDWGADYAMDMLSDIHTVSHRAAPFKIETEDYSIYWAGKVLRIDVKRWVIHNG